MGGGRCARCGWIFRSALLDADIVQSLGIQLGPWFVQALTTGEERTAVYARRRANVLKTQIHGLEVVIQLDG